MSIEQQPGALKDFWKRDYKFQQTFLTPRDQLARFCEVITGAVPEVQSGIYADHDEYCTFLASSKSNLNKVVLPLREVGFQVVEGYIRRG